MKNLDDQVIGLTNKAKSAPTPEARFGSFLTEYNDLILKTPNVSSEVRDLVTAVSSRKQEISQNILHSA